MNNNISILLIPADDRPVSYSLPVQVGASHKKATFFLPPREYLGNLTKTANTDLIFEWIEKTLSENTIDYVVCALDTIAYGGLVSSRRTMDSKEQILARLQEFRSIIEHFEAKVYGFSSIMRISNNNINEEEKLYWDTYGELIFRYSYLSHKGENCDEIKAKIPAEILEDYINTRERNFSVNKTYIEWQKQGFFDFLVFTKDDTAEFGLNVAEAGELQKLAPVHTGFDEVITSLTARILAENFPEKIKICPVYSTENGLNIVPRYEDIPLFKNIQNHISLCGCELAELPTDADIILLAHTPQSAQNDLVPGVFVEPSSEKSIDFCLNLIKTSGKPVILADVKNANGADDELISKIIAEAQNLDLYGYAGWNTASNTIGTALSMGIARYIAEKEHCFSKQDFNKLLFIRFSDDWAYQAVARQKSDKIPEMLHLTKEVARVFKINPDLINLTFPWNRNFEIEINC